MTSLSDLIPKEKQSAYQRWELASLHDGNGDDAGQNAHDKATTAALIEQEFVQGRASAHDEGKLRCRGPRREVSPQRETLERAHGRAARRRWPITWARREQRLARCFFRTSHCCWRVSLVGEALAVRRELVLPVVSAALKQLPQASQQVQVMLNPSDVELVRTFDH